jgi:hypothetical protein
MGDGFTLLDTPRGGGSPSFTILSQQRARHCEHYILHCMIQHCGMHRHPPESRKCGTLPITGIAQLQNPSTDTLHPFRLPPFILNKEGLATFHSNATTCPTPRAQLTPHCMHSWYALTPAGCKTMWHSLPVTGIAQLHNPSTGTFPPFPLSPFQNTSQHLESRGIVNLRVNLNPNPHHNLSPAATM